MQIIEVQAKVGKKKREIIVVSIDEEDSKNLKSLLKSLAREKATEYIRDGCVVTINKELVTNDVELKDKDEIIIMPMLHGG